MNNITYDQIKTLRLAIIASAVMLFLAIPSDLWPYGYYVLLRWVVAGTGVFAAYVAYNLGKIFWAIAFGVVVLLFNPIIPIHLAKENWVVIDLFVAVFYLIMIPIIRLPKIDEPKTSANER